MTPALRYEACHGDVCPDLLEQFRKANPDSRSTLWRKRNWIWRYEAPDGSQWAVKRFADRWLSRLIYAVRASKARRSYHYATELEARGIHTPAHVCYAEWRGPFNVLLASVYVSEYEDSQSLDAALETSADKDEVLRRLADFFVSLHNAGFIHGDANRTNLRIGANGEIGIIDLNRMKVYPAGVVPSADERLNDICEWSAMDDDFASFAGHYASALKDPAVTQDAVIAFKLKHDRKVDTLKKLKHPLRYLFGKKRK